VSRSRRLLAETFQKNTDDVLTWTIGLMGAGLLGLPSFISATCPSSPRRLALLATPWTLGVLFAVASRIVGRAHRHADTMLFFRKVHAVERLLLDRAHPFLVAEKLLSVMNDDDETFRKRIKAGRRLRDWVEAGYYASHIALAVGVLAIFWKASKCF
jgi:hypothetical protein